MLYYKELSEMKKGQVLYDEGRYNNLRITLIEDPIETSDNQYTQLRFKATTDEGEEMSYMVTKGMEHYGPKLYTYPAYTTPTMLEEFKCQKKD